MDRDTHSDNSVLFVHSMVNDFGIVWRLIRWHGSAGPEDHQSLLCFISFAVCSSKLSWWNLDFRGSLVKWRQNIVYLLRLLSRNEKLVRKKKSKTNENRKIVNLFGVSKWFSTTNFRIFLHKTSENIFDKSVPERFYLIIFKVKRKHSITLRIY